MTQIAQQNPTGQNNNPAMAFKIHKEGRILETTLKVKDATVKADVDIVFLMIAALMISLINIIYLVGIL